MAEDRILQTVQRLFTQLHARGVPYVLVGGIAMLHYVEGRNTEDIDLILALSDLEAIPDVEIQERDVYFARGRFHGLQVDFLLTENPLFRLVQARYAVERPFLDQTIRVATVEGLLLLKLYALPSLYRQGDFLRVGIYENDIAALMYTYHPDMEAILATLADYVSEGDLATLREIVQEIQERIRRFRTARDESVDGDVAH